MKHTIHLNWSDGEEGISCRADARGEPANHDLLVPAHGELPVALDLHKSMVQALFITGEYKTTLKLGSGESVQVLALPLAWAPGLPLAYPVPDEVDSVTFCNPSDHIALVKVRVVKEV